MGLEPEKQLIIKSMSHNLSLINWGYIAALSYLPWQGLLDIH